MATPFKNITSFLKNIFDSIVEFFKGFGDFVSSLFSYINPFSDNFFLKNFTEIIQNYFKALFDYWSTLFSYINPFSDNFFIKIAFVPKMDNLNINKLNKTLSNKFAFYDDIKSLFNSFTSTFNKVEDEPDFTITLPSFLGGATLNALDLRFYNNFRVFINTIIISFAYFFYFRKLFSKIPNLVKGQ